MPHQQLLKKKKEKREIMWKKEYDLKLECGGRW